MRSYLIALLARVEREPRYRQLGEAGDAESRHFILKDAVTPLFVCILQWTRRVILLIKSWKQLTLKWMV